MTVRNMRIRVRTLWRSLYYFKMGYALYLTYLLGIVSTLVTVYYLAVKAIPSLLFIFHDFTTFSVVCLIVGVPVTIMFGWAHYKGFLKSAFKAEQDIGTEANPYTTTIIAPVNLSWLRLQVQIAKKLDLDTSEVEQLIVRTESKFGLSKRDADTINRMIDEDERYAW